MRSVVPSLNLRVVYLLVGGLPSLYLSGLCAVFFPSALWATYAPEVSDQPKAVFAATILALGILGTISGWLVFFALGTSSRMGRLLHYIAIGGGILAAMFFLFALPLVTLSAFLVFAGPVLVGCCLLFHLSRAAQPINPPDAAR